MDGRFPRLGQPGVGYYDRYPDYSSARAMSEAHRTMASNSLHPIITPSMNEDIYGRTTSIDRPTFQQTSESQLSAPTIRPLMGGETTSGLYHGYGREMVPGADVTHTAEPFYNDELLKSQSVLGNTSSIDTCSIPYQSMMGSQSSPQTIRPLMGGEVSSGLHHGYGREMASDSGVTQTSKPSYSDALLRSLSVLAKEEYGIDITELVNRSVKRKATENTQAMKRFHGESSGPSQMTDTFTDLNSLDLGPAEKLRMGLKRVIALLKAEVNGNRLTDPRLLSKIVHESKTGLQIIYSDEASTIVDSEYHANVFLGRLHIGSATAQDLAWVKKRAFGSAVNTLLTQSVKVILKRIRIRPFSKRKKKFGEDEEGEEEEEEEDIPVPVPPTTQPDVNDISVKFGALSSRICKSKYDAASVVKLLDGYTIQSSLAPVSYYSKACNSEDGGERFRCDLCMDDVSVSAGEGADLKAAQLNAYIQAWERLTTESVTQILEYSPRMTEQMKHDPKYVEVFQKGQKEFTWTNTLLLESHHPAGPNLARSLSDLVILETEEWANEGAFSVLNNSAAMCGLLMEWVFQKDKHGHSRCNIYIQKQQLGTAKDVLRYKAREQASMNALKGLFEHHDFIQECPKDASQTWYAWDRLQIDARMSEGVLEADTMSDDEYQQIIYKKEAIYACNVVQQFFSNESNNVEECIFDPYMPLAEQQFIKYYVMVFLGLEARQKTHTDGRLYLAVSKIIPLPEIVSILKQSDAKSVGKYCFLNPDGVPSETYASFLIDIKVQAQAQAQVQAQTQILEESNTLEQTQAETKSRTQAKTQLKTPAQTALETEAQTQLKTPAQTALKPQAQTQLSTPAQTPLKTQAQTQLKTPAQTPLKSQAQTPLKTQAQTQSNPRAPTQSQTLAKIQSKTQSKSHLKTNKNPAASLHVEEINRPVAAASLHVEEINRPVAATSLHVEEINRPVAAASLHVEEINRPVAVQQTTPDISAQMKQLPDLQQQLMESPPTEEVSEKLKTLTKGILWFTNLHVIKQMYGTFAEQDLERPLSELVLMENETSASQLHSAFLNLRTSASKCGILIDWSVEKKGQEYECCLYMQKRLFSRGISNTKAMDACLESFYSAVVNLYQTNPVIQITHTEPTRILWQELQAEALDWEPEPMDEVCLSYDDSTIPLKYRTETMYTCSILRDFFQDRDKRYEELELKDIPAEVDTIVRKYAQSELNCCHRKKRVARSLLYQYYLMSSAKDLLQAIQKSETGQVGKYRLLNTDELIKITTRRTSQQSSSGTGNIS